MAMAWLWTGMVAVSRIFGALTGNLNALSAAALEGAQSAVELCLAMCGVMCLWTGVMEVMNQCHLTDRLASLFRPLLKRLLPNASRDSETLAAISLTSLPIFWALATRPRRSASALPAA